MKQIPDYEDTQNILHKWREALKKHILNENSDLLHSFHLYFDSNFVNQLQAFSQCVATKIEALAQKNNLHHNLPNLQKYNDFGEIYDKVHHHESYNQVGNLIYSSGITQFLGQKGQLSKSLALLLLSSHAGEAGHNCPIACTAGIVRVLLQESVSINFKDFYIKKLCETIYEQSFSGAQFLTEIQGGSDVGLNACKAVFTEDNQWKIYGEKWFCSNVHAELILMTARIEENSTGTKGLGLFLVTKNLNPRTKNAYTIRRLKNKFGTRSMATGEIIFEGATGFLIAGEADGTGIKMVLENVLHISRIFNAFSVLGMTRRAFQIAFHYAQHREVFGKTIIHYPLVQKHLAEIKAYYTAQLAASFKIAAFQDKLDLLNTPEAEQKLYLRLLVNFNKYFTAKYSVDNIRHCIDILAGNGTIYDFSSLPRLLSDAIVCENWEGTHFTLWMQILRDIEKYEVDKIFLKKVSEDLSNLSEKDAEYQMLLKLVQTLETSLQQLKAVDAAEKTLIIEKVVTLMGFIFSGIALANEAKGAQSKLDCLELFLLLAPYENHKGISSTLYETITRQS